MDVWYVKLVEFDNKGFWFCLVAVKEYGRRLTKIMKVADTGYKMMMRCCLESNFNWYNGFFLIFSFFCFSFPYFIIWRGLLMDWPKLLNKISCTRHFAKQMNFIMWGLTCIEIESSGMHICQGNKWEPMDLLQIIPQFVFVISNITNLLIMWRHWMISIH